MLRCSDVLYLQLVDDDSPMYDLTVSKSEKAARKQAQKVQLLLTVGPAHIGCRVKVQGAPVAGTLRWYGNHKLDGEPRCGVQLDSFDGKTFGVEQAQQYFSSPPGTGVIVSPDKVSFVPITDTDVGKKVRVAGFKCVGKLVFFGPHITEGTSRCGVVLEKPLGNTNGTIKDHKYFQCKDSHGLLTKPEKVYLFDPPQAKTSNHTDLLKAKSVDNDQRQQKQPAKPGAAGSYDRVIQMAEQMKRLMNGDDESDDDEDLPDLPPDGGDTLPDLPDADSDDDEELPTIPDDTYSDDDLPEIPDGFSSSEDEALPELGDIEDSDDDELPPGPASNELDLDFNDPFLSGHNTKDDTEV